MNQWFWRHGWSNHASCLSRVNVLCGKSTGLIVGYVTLSAGQIERAALQKSDWRNKPDPLPATLLGQLAVHRDHQGRGYARSLLLFALGTALRASRDVASWGIITHPVDDTVRPFYVRYGFQDLPYDPRRSMVVRMSDLEKSWFASG